MFWATYVEWVPDPGNFDFSSNDFFDETEQDTNILMPHAIDSSANADLLYSLLDSGLSQVNHVRNFRGRILDLVFCNDPSDIKVSKSDLPMVKIDVHHEPIEMKLGLETMML